MTPAPTFNTLAFVSVMLVGCGLSLFWALGLPRLYEAVGEIQSFKLEDAKQAKALISSDKVVERVASRLSAEDKRLLIAQGRGGDEAVSTERLLARNLRVKTDLHTLMTTVGYRSPDPQFAARMAELYLDETIARAARQKIDAEAQEVELFVRALEKQRAKTTDAFNALIAYPPYQRLHRDANDETLQALLVSAKSEEAIYDAQIAHLKTMVGMGGIEISKYRLFPDKRSPAELPQLRWPIIRNTAWGCLNTLLVAAVLATPFMSRKVQATVI